MKSITKFDLTINDKNVKVCFFNLVCVYMAKKNVILIRLESTAGTGYFYVKKKNPKKLTRKLSFTKFDPIARKHVEFVEKKIKG